MTNALGDKYLGGLLDREAERTGHIAWYRCVRN